jgi:hypothetical protein
MSQDTTPTTEQPTAAPILTLDSIVAGLVGFGIEDCSEPIVIESNGRTVELFFANIPTEEERLALLAVEELKGYTWMQQVKLEVLSRSISRLNGVSIRGLVGPARIVVDPKDGTRKDIQVVIRELIGGWGQEVVAVLWKLLMVHAQNIEDRLYGSFSDIQKNTEVERRYLERAEKEIEDITRDVITEQINGLFSDDEPAPSESK